MRSFLCILLALPLPAPGQIAVCINDPDAMLGGMVGDAELPARLAPQRAARAALDYAAIAALLDT